jgi:hypothetical protein
MGEPVMGPPCQAQYAGTRPTRRSGNHLRLVLFRSPRLPQLYSSACATDIVAILAESVPTLRCRIATPLIIPQMRV